MIRLIKANDDGSPSVVSEENKSAKDEKSKSGEEEEQHSIAP